jgi:hypothetical protein
MESPDFHWRSPRPLLKQAAHFNIVYSSAFIMRKGATGENLLRWIYFSQMMASAQQSLFAPPRPLRRKEAIA